MQSATNAACGPRPTRPSATSRRRSSRRTEAWSTLVASRRSNLQIARASSLAALDSCGSSSQPTADARGRPRPSEIMDRSRSRRRALNRGNDCRLWTIGRTAASNASTSSSVGAAPRDVRRLSGEVQARQGRRTPLPSCLGGSARDAAGSAGRPGLDGRSKLIVDFPAYPGSEPSGEVTVPLRSLLSGIQGR
jgi:hypothetical protein